MRIDDLDPPREEAGAASIILKQLEAHGLTWDGEVLYQSTRDDAYLEALKKLGSSNLTYYCQCTRARLKGIGGTYDGHCAQLQLQARGNALRLKTSSNTVEFQDLLCGYQHQDPSANGDFIVKRRDGLFAYPLAAVVDDHYQGITHIIRGRDLLPETPRQLYLFDCLGIARPTYGHLPLAIDHRGQKLSKQNRAPALRPAQSDKNLWLCLRWLGQCPPLELEHSGAELLSWAVEHWARKKLPDLAEQPAPEFFL